MSNRPDERDQVRMVVKGAHPSISGRLHCTVVKTFEDLLEVRLLIEEIKSENRRNFQRRRPRTEATQKQVHTGGSSRDAEIHAIQSRWFSNFGKPMSKVFEKLKAKGLLKPLPPKQGEVPAHVDKSFFCQFHQRYGHSTNRCTCLRHEIQDLIDNGKITDPEESRLSTGKNPLPNHANASSVRSILMIGSGLTTEEVMRSFENDAEIREEEVEEEEEVTSRYLPLWDQDEDSEIDE